MSDPRPIGVFDSGVGGLTVLRELQRQLPSESTIYFADLGHFPYGPRYQAQVRHFALNIIRFLEKLDVKMVVIACNTATAAALNTAREVFDIPIIGVITPGSEAALAATKNKRVGVISTEGTMQSQEYLHAIREANPTIQVLPRAAPQLVDLVEGGKADAPETEAVLRETLRDILDYQADTLILGCTHYPLLKRMLAKNGLESAENETARHQIYVTGSPERFTQTARHLFGQDLPPITTVRLELVEELSGREGAA